MLDILLSEQSGQPLYQQLYTQIRNHIRSGVIANGTRLPSIRALQLHLNISKTPIETAYQMLTVEGYVVSKPRSGLYAVQYVHENVPVTYGGTREMTNLQGTGMTGPQNSVIDFDPSAVDRELFPLRTWSKMLNGALERNAAAVGRYGDPQGEYTLRSVLTDYLRNSRGVVCSPEQIVIGSGIAYSIGILAKLLTEVQQVAFEDPGYDTVREQLILSGKKLIPIPVDEKGISLIELQTSGAQAVYVTPSHQFPTGSIMPYREREGLLEWSYAKNAYIIEDDYDGEFRYQGKPVPSLQGLDRYGRVIYIGTFSKAFTPALRMNYMVLPLELLKRMRCFHHMLSSPSRIEQWAMQAFIESGHWYRHIRRMRNAYRKKHRRLLEWIHNHFSDVVEVTGHSAGLHIQVTVKTRLSAGDLLKLAAAEGVRVYDFHGMWIRPNPTGDPKVYLGFAGMSEKDMEYGILLLKKAWSPHL